uniref:Fibrinogen C-terminal domain-containing protein n=1 Tax=Amphimedon queenslandica TaxID=400682 RepID=A0A1X7VI78_AMPQE
MEGEDNLSYVSVKQDSVTEDNVYEFVELSQTSAVEEKRAKEPKDMKKRKDKEPKIWNKPIIIIIIVLLSLIVILQVGILYLLLAHIMPTRDTPCTTGAIAGNNEYSNFTQWANDIVNKVNSNVTGSFPDFNEWADGVVSKVNSNVTGSLPDFNEWANGVVSKVNSNVTGSFPDFNEWANGVVSKVNSNVTGSLPDFNEWADGVVSKVNSNVTRSLPDFNEWTNGVVSKVNSNVTGSLPDFNEWANGVVSKVNSNVTGSLPDFNEWADGVVFKVNSNITGSLPDFNEWANGVVSKVNSNVTGSLPDFNEWANGVVSKVNSNVTGSLPDFNEWANGVVFKVNSNVTGSLPDFNEWANGISQNTLQLFQNNTNFTELDKQILHTTRDSAQKLINIVNTLSNIQDTSTSTAGVVDDTFWFMIHLLLAHNSSFGFSTSCKQINNLLPTSPSGNYILASANGSTTYTAYCNMEELCGSGGGWTRLAYLDMSDSTVNCPSGFRLYQSGGVRACGRPVTSSGSCVSVQFPSNGISYSQVCGRVTGYQYASPDAVYSGGSNHNNLNSYYVDGVSITRGSPRQHVWTLMAGLNGAQYPLYTCPCADDSTQQVQSFVGDHYYCETAIFSGAYQQQLYASDPLWDGQGCVSGETACCNVSGIPWFHRDYGNTTTTDYIELRVCGDEGTSNEDVPVSYYEIYVQ